MSFVPPVSSIMLALRAAGELGANEALTEADAEAIITEAGRFAAEEVAPLNRIGDKQGAQYANGVVTTAPGWRDAYRKWCAAGWSSVAGPAAHGGQELPMVMAVACAELWNAANLAFAVNPLLTNGAIEAITAHATAELKAAYLPNMIAGVWTGTMNLTEPQSGSDLSGLRCKAERAGDGTYRISGTKIYITYGEHDCADNIIHLVLARLSDAPLGTRGISLFLVPKILPDGSRNDLRCSAIEHKLGLHGSPTCTMIYGDAGGAKAWLIGEENRGLACMFTMMNNARLLVGVQGVGLAERATQLAFAYARERKQGRAASRTDGQSAIIEHPDVHRMLLEMRSKTAAARMLCMATAAAVDASHSATDHTHKAQAAARASLLTPLAKAFSTDVAVAVASLAVQVHGGMGYIEEAGAAQLLRDARILPIYEGTNGIQAADLVIRKVLLDQGAALRALLADCDTLLQAASEVTELKDSAKAAQRASSSFQSCCDLLQKADQRHALLCSSSFLQALSSLVSATYLLKAAGLARGTADATETQANSAFLVHACLTSDVARCEALLSMPEHAHALSTLL
jgi:acyl-CoA dehydrogenase